MNGKDSFVHKLQPLGEFHKIMDVSVRFNERNKKTLGFIVYSTAEQDLMRAQLDERVDVNITDDMRPDTKLAR